MFKIMTSTVVVGGFFGDEGKGKIISYLAIKDNPKIIRLPNKQRQHVPV